MTRYRFRASGGKILTLAMIHAKRDQTIKRGNRNEDEYYLIRDLVDELEGEPGRSQLLNKLYMMVDEFAVD